MFVKGGLTGQLTWTAGILKSQCPSLGYLWSEEVGAEQGGLGNSRQNNSGETNPNFSPSPTLQHFCGSLGHLFI